MPLRNRLKEFRVRLAVNQQEMGRLAGVSRQTIMQLERNRYNPSMLLVYAIAQVFGVTIEELFDFSEE